jgi:hypothetical protein
MAQRAEHLRAGHHVISTRLCRAWPSRHGRR